jgi:type VI secretion system protein ImpA
VLTACDALGSDYEHVASEIRGAIRSLMRDLKYLVDLTLMDDSPTANKETRGWLRNNGMLDAGDDAAEEVRSTAPRAGPRRDPYEAAMSRVRAGEPRKAIEMLMREASQEKSDRARFLRKSQAATVMVDAGLEPVAVPILEEMLEQIEKHGLEEWEAGETVAQPLGLMYRCLKKLDGDESTAESLYLRVCRLDPMQAIHFRKPNDVDAGE